MDGSFKPVTTLFNCINAFNGATSLALSNWDSPEMRVIKLPCSAMVQDVYLLRAFEAGSDSVVVLTCPEGQCLHVSGTERAKKRVERVKRLLDAIGLDGRRLSLLTISHEDEDASAQVIRKALAELEGLGPSPANRAAVHIS